MRKSAQHESFKLICRKCGRRFSREDIQFLPALGPARGPFTDAELAAVGAFDYGHFVYPLDQPLPAGRRDRLCWGKVDKI